MQKVKHFVEVKKTVRLNNARLKYLICQPHYLISTNSTEKHSSVRTSVLMSQPVNEISSEFPKANITQSFFAIDFWKPIVSNFLKAGDVLTLASVSRTLRDASILAPIQLPTDNFHRSGASLDRVSVFIGMRQNQIGTLKSLTHSHNYSIFTGHPAIFSTGSSPIRSQDPYC